MVTVYNTADGGTNGSGATGTLTLANSTNSGFALTPTGVAALYSNTVTRRGLAFQFVTPSGSSYVTTPITGSPTSMSVMFYDWIPSAVTATSEVWSIRNVTTRVAALNQIAGNQLQFFGVSTTALYTFTANIPTISWYRVNLGWDASGAWFIKMYAGDSLTSIESGSGSGADFTTAGAPTIMNFGKRSGTQAMTRYMDDLAYNPGSFTEIAPTGTTVGPLGIVAHIGDSTSSQDGNGSTNVPARYVAGGWLPGDIWFYGVGSKTITGSDANGKTTMQNIQDARATVGQEPAVWVIGLGTNSRSASDATTLSDVTAVMNEINSIGSPGKVLWVGISQSTAGGGLDANSVRRNNYIASLAGTTFPTMTWVDLDAYLRNGRDERDIWFAPPDANFAHMSVGGYVLRNSFIATKARLLATGLPNVILDLNGSGALTADVPYYLGTAPLSGSGTLSAARTVQFAVPAVLTGSGALSAASTPRFNAATPLSGSGSLTAVNVPKFTAATPLSGGGTLGTTGTLAVVVTATLSGSGSLISGTGAGSVPQLTGSGALSAILTPRVTSVVSLTGSGSLAASGAGTPSGVALLTGSGSLSAITVARVIVLTSLSGTGSLTTFSGTPPFNPGSYSYTALRVREYHGFIPPRSD